MKFTIYEVNRKNGGGYLLILTKGKKTEWYIFSLNQRMTMLAFIDKTLGPEIIEEDNWALIEAKDKEKND